MLKDCELDGEDEWIVHDFLDVIGAASAARSDADLGFDEFNHHCPGLT